VLAELLGAPAVENLIDLAAWHPEPVGEVVEDGLARHLAVGVHLDRHGVRAPVSGGDLDAKQLAVGRLPGRLAGQATDSRAEPFA